MLPIFFRDEINKEKEITRSHLEQAKKANQEKEEAVLELELLQFDSALEAEEFSQNDLLKHARQKFFKLLKTTKNFRILGMAFKFFVTTADYESAQQVLNVMNNYTDFDCTTRESAYFSYLYGFQYLHFGNIEGAKSAYLNSLKFLINDDENRELVGQILKSLGGVFLVEDNYDEAEEYLNRALKIYLDIPNIKITSGVYSRLAEVYIKKEIGKMQK